MKSASRGLGLEVARCRASIPIRALARLQERERAAEAEWARLLAARFRRIPRGRASRMEKALMGVGRGAALGPRSEKVNAKGGIQLQPSSPLRILQKREETSSGLGFLLYDAEGPDSTPRWGQGSSLVVEACSSLLAASPQRVEYMRTGLSSFSPSQDAITMIGRLAFACGNGKQQDSLSQQGHVRWAPE